jgi:MerR family transcriptional regulator, light-induced transcriptional regulator
MRPQTAQPHPHPTSGDPGGAPHAHPFAQPLSVRDRLGAEFDGEEVERFFRLLQTGPESALDLALDRFLARGIPADRLLLELFRDAALRLGDDWEQDRCTFLDVALGTGRLQRLLRALTRREMLQAGLEAPPTRKILLSSFQNQQHTFGLLMAAEFFQRAQWTVSIGAPLNPKWASDLVQDEHFDVVGLAIPMRESASAVRREISRIRTRSRNRQIGILVGGAAVSRDPDLVDEVGADAAAPDARLAPSVAEAFL